MKLEVVPRRSSPNLPVLQRVLERFQARGVVRLECTRGADFLTAHRHQRRREKMTMPVPSAWLECPEKSPYLERVAELFCQRAFGPSVPCP